MNFDEHLLVVLQEEALEVAHACSKALRFGLDDGYPGTDRTNRSDLEKEIIELQGMIAMLTRRGIICDTTGPSARTAMVEKENRVLKFMEYAKARGALVVTTATTPPAPGGNTALRGEN